MCSDSEGLWPRQNLGHTRHGACAVATQACHFDSILKRCRYRGIAAWDKYYAAAAWHMDKHMDRALVGLNGTECHSMQVLIVIHKHGRNPSLQLTQDALEGVIDICAYLLRTWHARCCTCQHLRKTSEDGLCQCLYPASLLCKGSCMPAQSCINSAEVYRAALEPHMLSTACHRTHAVTKIGASYSIVTYLNTQCWYCQNDAQAGV